MQFYDASPIWMQNLFCTIEGGRLRRMRYGGGFRNFVNQYIDRDSWSRDRLIAHRDERLQSMVKWAYVQCPYYHDLFNDGGVNPDRIKGLADLSVLPILTKSEARLNVQKIIPRELSSLRTHMESTSGSTGAGLQFPVENVATEEQYAAYWSFLYRLGVNFDTWCADFGSRVIVPARQVDAPFWRECAPLKQVKFSAFHGTPSTYYSYYKEIDKRKIEWIHGYPSCITPFASFLHEEGLRFRHQIKFITTSAENLYDHQRNLIERAFGTRPYSLYGLTELTGHISEDKSHVLRVDEDFSVMEFLPQDGGLCKIVGTGFVNRAFPFLRYDSGDMAVCESGSNDAGAKRVVKALDGRSGDHILLPNGGKVGALSALFVDAESIQEAQICQHKDYSVTIRYVSSSADCEEELLRAKERFSSRVQGQIECNFERLDKLSRTKRGKLRYVISEIDEAL